MNYSGKNLKFLIDKLGISQASIEAIVGKRQQTISNWINERNQMDAEDLIKLVDHFGLSLEDFCLMDLSKGNLINQQYIAQFMEKGNLKGNRRGNPNPTFHQNIGESLPANTANQGGQDDSFNMVMIMLREVISKLDRISASIDSKK